MRFKKIVPAHVEERVVSDGTICDGCGESVEKYNDAYRADDITIAARLGNVFPEGDCRTVYDLDVCSGCFVDKVIPALASAGLVFRERDIDEDDRVLRVVDADDTCGTPGCSLPPGHSTKCNR
jgi:hypothetical protein